MLTKLNRQKSAANFRRSSMFLPRASAMKRFIWSAQIFLLTFPVYADVSVYGKTSSLGDGVEIAFPITQTLDGRLAYTAGTDTASTYSSSYESFYRGTAKKKNLELMFDWHIEKSSCLRGSIGLVNFNHHIEMSSDRMKIGGITTSIGPGEYINATVDFRKFAPYLGIGCGRTKNNRGLSFTSDMGLFYMGSPNSVKVTTNIAGATANDEAAAAEDLRGANVKFFPVISIGIGYTF